MERLSPSTLTPIHTATIDIAVRTCFPSLLLALLIGCANQEPAPAPPIEAPVPAPSAAQNDARPLIVAFGDSLTAGFGLDTGQSFPDLLQKELPAWHVVNAGVSGDTTSGGLERLASVVARKPAIVILELGANDGLRGIPVATTHRNLDELLTGLKQSGAKVLLVGITLPRNYGAAYIRDFDRLYPELARKHAVPLLPFLLEGVALDPGLMQPDALHPNAAGTRIVAATVRKALTPLLAGK